MHRSIRTLTFFALLLTSITTVASNANWKAYRIAEWGFTVALPSEPQSRLLPTWDRDFPLRVYESIEAGPFPSKFSVFIGMPKVRGIYEPESMDAFLNVHIASMVAVEESGKLISSRRITFRGRPALEYRFSHLIEGVPYITRGVALMLDGGHMEVLMQHPSNAPQAKATYKRFLESFKLTPIGYIPAENSFADPRGISLTPPKGWIQKPAQNPFQAVRFSHLTRSMLLSVAGVPSYTCDSFQAEIQASGRLKSVSSVRLANQQFKKLLAFEDVPKHKVRLTTVQYCLNSKVGAVVLGGAEEEDMFPRWADVFEGTAASIEVQ